MVCRFSLNFFKFHFDAWTTVSLPLWGRGTALAVDEVCKQKIFAKSNLYANTPLNFNLSTSNFDLSVYLNGYATHKKMLPCRERRPRRSEQTMPFWMAKCLDFIKFTDILFFKKKDLAPRRVGDVAPYRVRTARASVATPITFNLLFFKNHWHFDFFCGIISLPNKLNN